MPITAKANFAPDERFYNGACIVCGQNYSPIGAPFGVQCVDLDVVDKIDGAIALCFDCARQVGRAARMVAEEDSIHVLEAAIKEQEDCERVRLATREERKAAEAAVEQLRDLAGKIARTPPPPVVQGFAARENRLAG